jgi:hypothetical protein
LFDCRGGFERISAMKTDAETSDERRRFARRLFGESKSSDKFNEFDVKENVARNGRNATFEWHFRFGLIHLCVFNCYDTEANERPEKSAFVNERNVDTRTERNRLIAIASIVIEGAIN